MKYFFGVLPQKLDSIIRHAYLRLGLTYQGAPDKVFGKNGHPTMAALLPVVLLYFLVNGPTAGFRGSALLLWIVFSLVMFLISTRWFHKTYYWVMQVGVLVAAGLSCWILADPSAKEAGGTLYRHNYLPLLLIFVIVPMLLGRFLKKFVLKRFSKEDRAVLRPLLPKTELFQERNRFEPTISEGLRGFLSGPLKYPLQFLFMPSIGILLVPVYMPLKIWALIFVMLSWVLLGFSFLHPRLDFILMAMRRMMFTGVQVLPSFLIILFAVARLKEISYVTTVIDSASWSTILMFFAGTYAGLWFLEYWLNRFVNEVILGIFDSSEAQAEVDRLDYVIDDEVHRSANVGVPKDDRSLQVHGFSAIVAIRPSCGVGQNNAFFHLYERGPLLTKISDSGENAAKMAVIRLSNRIRFFFSAINIWQGVMIALVFFFIFGPKEEALWRDLEQESNVKKTDISLQSLLFEQDRDRAILVAFSGGGTRAALYSASVLEGLHDLNVMDDLVLTSAVSGGAAAQAYYANNRQYFKNRDEWCHFYEVMAYPYIGQVLRSTAEFRVMDRVVLGSILNEAFSDQFKPNATLKGVHKGNDGSLDFGLVFNTSVAGFQAVNQTSWKIFDADLNKPSNPSAQVSGQRLVFTNLSASAFPDSSRDPFPSRGFQYEVVPLRRDQLTKASAASANFPPVFPNAAVDLLGKGRFWVTDGGAVENRALLSLLFPLRQALQQELKSRQSSSEKVRNGETKEQRKPPAIVVVMADASFSKLKFKQSRGLGAALSAKEKLADGLIRELWQDIQATYAALGGVSSDLHFSNLAMPLVLRSNGGFGTHWMLPRRFQINPPEGIDPCPNDPRSISLSRHKVKKLIAGLHQNVDAWSDQPSSSVQDCHQPPLRRWLDYSVPGYPRHRDVWDDLKSVLTSD